MRPPLAGGGRVVRDRPLNGPARPAGQARHPGVRDERGPPRRPDRPGPTDAAPAAARRAPVPGVPGRVRPSCPARGLPLGVGRGPVLLRALGLPDHPDPDPGRVGRHPLRPQAVLRPADAPDLPALLRARGVPGLHEPGGRPRVAPHLHVQHPGLLHPEPERRVRPLLDALRRGAVLPPLSAGPAVHAGPPPAVDGGRPDRGGRSASRRMLITG